MRQTRSKWVIGLALVVAIMTSTPSWAAASARFVSPVPTKIFEFLHSKNRISKVRFTQDSYSIAVKSSLDMSKRLAVSPSNAIERTMTWSSDSPTVIAVDAYGKVTALEEGSATITATSVDNPMVFDRCTVKGKAIRVSKVTVNKANLTMDAGDEYRLSSTVAPQNATYQGISWSSSDELVATVDENGNVKAVKSGIAKVVASVDGGRKTAAAMVRVRGGSMKTVKLSAVGDVVLGGDTKKVPKADKPIGDGMTSYKRFQSLYNRYGQDHFFGGVQHIFQQDDVSVMNFEGTLTNSNSAVNKTFAFKGPKEYREIVRTAGMDVACLANNHAMDFGSGGYKDTSRALNGVGIADFGNGRYQMTSYVANGVKIGFVGFTLPASYGNIEKGIEVLKKKQNCDIVVVSYHWTQSKEWKNGVSSQEKAFARYAVNQGADLVLGHHKHVVSGVEQYKGRMIVYDLGNFVAVIRNTTDDGKLTDKDSMIYQQKFNVFSDGFVEYVEPNFIPCMNSDVPDRLTGNVHLLGGAEADRVLNKIRNKTPGSSRHLVRMVEGY